MEPEPLASFEQSTPDYSLEKKKERECTIRDCQLLENSLKRRIQEGLRNDVTTDAPEGISQEMSDYLSGTPEILARYHRLKAQLLSQIEGLAEQAVGAPIEACAQRLSLEWRDSLDATMLRLFQLIDLSANEIAASMILAVEQFPDLALVDPVAIGGVAGQYDPWQSKISIANDTSSYKELANILMHEASHAILPARIWRNHRRLTEGVTEFLATEATEKPSSIYGLETSVARELHRINRRALYEFYFTGDADSYENSLTSSLTGLGASQPHAHKLAVGVLSLDSLKSFDVFELIMSLREPGQIRPTG